MTRDEAICYLADPHSMYTLPFAQEICAAFNVSVPKHLTVQWRNRQEAWHKYDAAVSIEGAGSGIQSAALSEHVAKELGIDTAENATRDLEQQVRFNVEQILKVFQKTTD